MSACERKIPGHLSFYADVIYALCQYHHKGVFPTETQFRFFEDISAIPRECTASVLYPTDAALQQAQEQAQAMGKALAEEILPTEPAFAFASAAGEEATCSVLTAQAGCALVNAACLAPNGVRRRNPKEGNFVVTSLNLGIVRTAGEQLELVFAPRSSVESLQEETLEALDLLGETFGFTPHITGRYPGWAFTEHSPIRGCHTPDEHQPLDSFSRFYQLLTDVLTRLAEK